ncbi:MAG: hypothetical protein RIQ81_354 [Pseudomonadota bacterium]
MATLSALSGFDARVTCRRLPNGMTFIHVPGRDDERLFLSCLIKAGSRVEGAHESGISHFLEHMMFRGSKKYPSFGGLAEAFEWLGGEWNAATGQEYTEYVYSGVRRNHREAFELFHEFISEPVFRDIEVERQIILRELHGELNEFGISTDVPHHVSQLVWTGHALARPIIGEPATLARITEQSLKDYRACWYRPDSMALCVVGGTAEEAEVGASLFGTYQAVGVAPPKSRDSSKHPPRKGLPASKVIENSDNEYQFQMAFRCEGQWHDNAPVYEILVRMLSDGFSARLPRRIREELGLVYDISSDATLLTDCGLMNINASVDYDNMGRFVSELGSLLRDVTESPVSARELEKFQRRALVDLEMAASEPTQVAFRCAWNELNGKSRSLHEYANRIMAVTADDIMRCAGKLFAPENRATVVLGPKAGTPSQSDGEPALSDESFANMIDRAFAWQ